MAIVRGVGTRGVVTWCIARHLSQDVRLLGDRLGEILRAQGGQALFDTVEKMRGAAKHAREADDEAEREAARQQLEEIAGSLDADQATEVVRAFTLYFQLINLAEDVERSRVLRARAIRGGAVDVRESLAACVEELHARGASQAEVLAALDDLDIVFVFTAHPTEARRRTTERLLARVREALLRLDRSELTPGEERGTDRRLRGAIEALWQHAGGREKRPEVLDEVKAGLWYLRNVLLDVMPRLQRRLHDALEAAYGEVSPLTLPSPVRFGSWMGSDRDGNPFVNDAVTERTLEFHRHIVLERYLADLDRLVDPLAATRARLADTTQLDRAIARAGQAVPEIVAAADARNPDEPLRKLLTFVRERVERARRFASGGYADAGELLADLTVIRETLLDANAGSLADDAVLSLIYRVRCFGFTLAELDVREDGRLHATVIAELLGEPDYPKWSEDRRVQALEKLELPSDGTGLSDAARRLLDLFGSIGRFQARFGSDSIHTYAISHAEGPIDVLEVLQLARLHRIDDALDIVPLLESRAALRSAGPLLEALFTNPEYARHLERRDQVQELLLGYSDSMKEAGILASRVEVLDAQRAASAAAGAHGLTLRVFHGRGGSVSRGGGPTHRAIRALPRSVFSGRVKITEQGETRAWHFGDPDLAARYLERALGAAMVVRFEARRPHDEAAPEQQALLAELADHSHETYRALIDTDGFLTYFHEATPLQQIGNLNIASRPARRGQVQGIEDLRAIPWVFAWSQSRHVITGWFGVGGAFEKIIGESGGLRRLQQLHRDSPFFRDLIDNVQMVLAKTDLPIASRYAQLCKDPAVRERMFTLISEEFARTLRTSLEVTGQSELLDEDPVLRKSIRLRNPYVDPLSYLQLAALSKLRAEDSDVEGWGRVARASVKGIAAGLRNTG